MLLDIAQIAIVLALILLLVRPMGRYMAAVFTGGRTMLDRFIDPIDGAIYRLSGIDTRQQMDWRAYVKAMLLTNLVMFVMLFVVLETQQFLPLDPDGIGAVDPFLAFNTAASFITNTNWQNYGGENTLSYFSQLFAIIFPQFTSAATGLVCGVAFIRGLGGSTNMGNFYVDLVRSITRILLPISIATGIVFVALGVPATFDGAVTAQTVSGSEQTITRGPVAALASIKHLGTNGGGWFNTNSAHPYENPNPTSNVLENVLMGLIPTSLIYMLGLMIRRMRHAWTLFWVMAGFFLVFQVIAYAGEHAGNPLLTALGLDPAQGNMEGHEVRFGQGLTSLFITSTTAFTTGTVDAMHDSLTPLASLTPISQMLLNMVFGGKGVGFINLIVFAILGVFMVGLMVGRTPEFLGKKIESHEVKLASFAFLMHPLLILFAMAITFALSLDLSSILNPGPHGFSEVMYMYTSQAANNGSAFAGITGNTPWFNVSGGLVIVLGRYVSIVLMLALAGSLAKKKEVPVTIGTMRTEGPLFGGVLAGTVLIIGALTFFPILALGPIVEQLAMLAGRTF
ncbi:MAG TPA: potassium-transporting ATPase subunit KdpA [Candidatus Acidoferrales bacterium]|nr:potassium-transporting ATPase subunit KdpA [Candidatus Acidoferrales bacterium]